MTIHGKEGIVASESKVIWSASPTPFLSDGRLDTAALERVVEHHVCMGVGGIFLAGTCGEGPLMPNEQRVELVRAVKKLAGARLRVAAQVSDTSAARVCENIRRMEEVGADFVVVAPPWIGRFCNRTFAHRYFREAIEAARAPVGLYILQQPPETGLDVDLWLEYAAHPKVRLVKDSSASVEYCSALAGLRRRRPDILALTGYEFDVLTPLAAGYDGALLGSGILIAGMIRRAVDALAAGDRHAADAWQKRSNEFLWDLFGRDLSVWLGGLKYALTRTGLFGSEYMHMSYPLSAADRERIDRALERECEVLRLQLR